MKPLYSLQHFLLVDLMYSFPLQDCGTKPTELLIYIDCRFQSYYHIRPLVQDIESLVTYLGKRKWDISNITYRSFSNNDLYTLDESDLKCNDSIFRNCSVKSPPFVAFKESKEWCQEKVSVKRIAFIFHVTSHKCEDSFYKQVNQEFYIASNLNIYFFIYRTTSSTYFDCLTQNFIYIKNLKEYRFLAELYSMICEDPLCPTQDLSYTTRNIFKSYYHVSSKVQSSDEAREYCSQIPNNYMLSLETMEELEFIFQYLQNDTSLNTISKLHLHIGLRFLCSNLEKWSSGFPLFLEHSVKERRASCFTDLYNEPYPQTCLVLTSSKYNDSYELFSKNSREIYYKEVDCKDEIKNAIVICECHSRLLSNALVYNTFYDNNVDFLISHFSFSKFINLVFQPSKFISSSLGIAYFKTKVYECNIDSRYFLYNNGCNMVLNKTASTKNHESNRLTAEYFLLDRYVVLEKDESLTKCKENIGIIKGQQKALSRHCRINKKVDNISSKCTKRNEKLIVPLEKVNCTYTNLFVYKCFLELGEECHGITQVKNCKTFDCPKNFFKCPNDYCIRLDQLGDGIPDCLFGEDEQIFYHPICFGKINFMFQEMCFPKSLFDYRKKFICSKKCPRNFTCISNVIRNSKATLRLEFFSMRLNLYNISNVIFPKLITFFFQLQILEFQASECKLNNFDTGMKHWNLLNLYSLDLSFNEMQSSEDFQSVYGMKKLKILNMSYNPITKIYKQFKFPDQLEIIDFSYTYVKSIPFNAFNNLKHLKSLSLKNTRINEFKDMGFPFFFTLDTLYIQEVKISNLETNFFKGLTIRSGLWTSDYRLCCPQVLNSNISSDKCYGPIDVISSCENLVGDVFKRFIIWIVVLVTVFGNGIVLAYKLAWNRKIFINAYEMYVTGLAFSDFLMGIYLMIISSVDIYYQDVYVLEEIHWRNGILCQISGFLSTLSNETSTFFICLITLDRYLTITYPFGEYRVSKAWTLALFTFAWLIGIVLAAVPIVVSTWEIYSSNSLCLALPFSSDHFRGWEFSFVVYTGVNFVLFLIIAVGQVAIFVNIYRKRRSMSFNKNCRTRRLQDLAVAKKLAFVAMSNFLCWFPIGIIGYFSMLGHTYDRDVYDWFAVFVLPINSALNPIIYTIPAIYARCKSNGEQTLDTSLNTISKEIVLTRDGLKK